MNVLVDTSVWSLVLRRALHIADRWTRELRSLIDDGRAFVIGPVRQELLSGVRDSAQFELLRQRLRTFPDVAVREADYEEAAAFSNRCRARGIQGSSIDFLICAVAVRRSMSILTTDRDFEAFEYLLPIKLHEIR